MADYGMVNSFSSGGASSLNGDVITKLREAEEEAVIDPFDKALENWDLESEKISEISAKMNELLETIKPFDLYASGNNAFEQISATTTGSSAVFDATDLGALKEGTYQVDITQLAQKDVWQSETQTLAQTEATMGVGTLTINGEDFLTDGLTLEQFAEKISLSSVASASVEQVGTDSYRLVLKSIEPGVDNALTITETGTSFGYNNGGNNTLVAQNLQGTVDGIAYDISSNSIQVDGNLKITATDEGESTLSIQRDDGAVIPAIQNIATVYNELSTMITDELYDAETPIEDKSTLRTMLSDIKNIMINSYNTVDGDSATDLNIVNFGFSFDFDGNLSIDETALGEALTNNFDDVKNLFLGVAEDEGLGTVMKEYIDGLNSYDGLFSSYTDAMISRKENLDEDKQKAIDTLDAKYGLMAAQFAAYGSIISQMESSFGGLEMMIKQSTSGS